MDRRLTTLDALRGAAIVWMIAFHFCFDLAFLGFARFRMLLDPFWTTQRTLIVSSFLLVAGFSVVLREVFKPGGDGFWKRWGQIAAAALLVSAGSYAVFPASFIYFGVLHFMAAALLITRPLLRLRGHIVWPALGVLAAHFLWQSEGFNPRWLNWVGFVTVKPITEDYVPLVPWLGVMWLGCAAGWLWDGRRGLVPSMGEGGGGLGRVRGGLAILGRWPLTLYLVHQPVLLALLMGLKSALGR